MRFITRVGTDPEGEEIRRFLSDQGFRLEDVQVNLDDKGVPQFDIVADVAYDHLKTEPDVVSALDGSIELIYFGTLVQRSESGYQAVQQLLKRRGSRTQCFYDVNLRPNSYSRPAVSASLRQADHVKLNEQELTMLQEMFGWTGTPAEAVQRLMETDELTTVSLTRGEDGSDLFTVAGHFTAPSTRPAAVVDTVGAGDAYAAVLIAGLLKGWQPEHILRAATEFAARICEIEGAIPADDSIYSGIFATGEVE